MHKSIALILMSLALTGCVYFQKDIPSKEASLDPYLRGPQAKACEASHERELLGLQALRCEKAGGTIVVGDSCTYAHFERECDTNGGNIIEREGFGKVRCNLGTPTIMCQCPQNQCWSGDTCVSKSMGNIK